MTVTPGRISNRGISDPSQIAYDSTIRDIPKGPSEQIMMKTTGMVILVDVILLFLLNVMPVIVDHVLIRHVSWRLELGLNHISVLASLRWRVAIARDRTSSVTYCDIYLRTRDFEGALRLYRGRTIHPGWWIMPLGRDIPLRGWQFCRNGP